MMKKNVTFKLAASTLALGLTVVGCKPASTSYRPAAVSANAVKGEAQAAKFYAQAQAAVAKRDLKEALTLTEQAVEFSPQDVGYRTLLGDLYLKNGRFLSAENAFTDVIALHPTNSRAALSLALAQIAQGKTREALQRLDSVAGELPIDAGLAYALAGQPQRAVEILEPAARAPGANARVRQNLALAYAVAGEWQKARVTASQDLSPSDVGQRMQEWAAFANPTTTYLQVATLLGTTPVADGGQPARLALAAAAPKQPAYAEAAPAPQAAIAVAEAEVPAPVEAPVAVAAAEPAQSFEYSPPQHGDAFAAPAAVAAVDVPAASTSERAQEISGSQFAAAVTNLVEAPQPILKSEAPSVRLASAPVRAFVAQKAARKAARGHGRYVVQLGAYRSAAQVEKAWAQAIRRYRFGNEPLSTTVSIAGRGTFHRLALSGFGTSAEAERVCETIRGKGGSCFVRANAGDAPVRWASRYSRNG